MLRPKELLAADGARCSTPLLPLSPRRASRVVDAWTFEPARARDALCEQFRTASLAGHGLEQATGAPSAAAGAIVAYLRDTQRSELTHVRDISLRVASRRAARSIPVTLRHLNVVEGVDGGRAGSLLDALDRTVTAMGGRLLRQWLVRPLVALARDPGSARRRRGLRVPH